ncbi:2-oxoglutarate dehydrogenase E1 component [Verrucomicrobium sp. 3C]|uniref:2-oxoglutarate dehydrogenase E1 component n=1 Tax=Verrucomicrobium sp. 3C TaxID=1134055 RepID=UPI0009DACA3E|nr:2-oxoglutarate dehydrogenase E1 component [Verrucomicrobium sp. 3C]
MTTLPLRADRLWKRDGAALAYSSSLVEEYYARWAQDPVSVDSSWRALFEGSTRCASPQPTGREAGRRAQVPSGRFLLKQRGAYELIFAYRTLGHFVANLDPLGFNRVAFDELELERFGLGEEDLEAEFDSASLAGGGVRSLRRILEILRTTYCGTLAVEFMHMQAFAQRRWITERLEGTDIAKTFSGEERRRILQAILRAEEFESFLHTRYVGQKRFSLEGNETLIPMLEAVVEGCPLHGVDRIVMGMAHRGRLNVLANVLQQDFKTIFDEFSENYFPEGVLGDGDVRYHLGFEAVRKTSSGVVVTIGLAPNPSHLEMVNPVVEGKARAWERRLGDTAERRKVLPLLIHGDASFMGQGIVQETLNLSQIQGYRTGGTVHIVINNQIGFTTLPQDARSTHHCTGVALMLGIPIFHVNGDDPLSAVFAIRLALEYRQLFQRDVVVDLFGYRRHGHNEGDEPSFTQPTLYQEIAAHPKISEVFLDRFVPPGEVTREEAQSYRKAFVAQLAADMAQSRKSATQAKSKLRERLSCPRLLERVQTAVPEEELLAIGRAITQEPAGFTLNPKIARMLQDRRAAIEGRAPILWPLAEALALGSLLKEGIPVRLSGQDSRRGTFSQRHAVLYDIHSRERYVPLEHLSPDQAIFCIYNSPLSENAVLGFDFGYSLDYPEALILWEAQYGDFANGVQGVIDQYLASSESKWGTVSHLVLLLPHGYEGQGPEHSSARIERFLLLCAEDNLIVAQCSTPANYFHILRRQALRGFAKPLVLFTPKSLLRDPRCSSSIADFSQGSFEEILPDPLRPEGARRVLLCSGKIYYDLVAHRERLGESETAILRIEQFYPLHQAKLLRLLSAHRAEEVIWCQEEPENMGGWAYIERRLRALLGREIRYVGREEAASTAAGSLGVHRLEQEWICEEAFRGA